MSQDQRYLVRPRRIKPQPPGTPPVATDQGALPQSKMPATVAIPVPVPVPVGGDGAEQNRYRVNPNLQIQQGVPAQQGFQFDPQKMPQFSNVQPEAQAPAEAVAAPEEEFPELKYLRAAEERAAAERGVIPKKDSWWKSALKMLAHGAADMPPARDWGELAYGAGRSAGAGVAGLVQHDLPGQIKKRYRVHEAQRELEQATKVAQVGSQIQSRSDLQRYRVARLGQFKDAHEEKKAFNAWRQKTGDTRLSEWQQWVQWRQKNGDRTALRQEDHLEWQQQAEEARMKQRRTEFDWRKESKKLDQVIARERIAATEGNKDDRQAADRAEAEILDAQADELENDAAGEEDEDLKAKKTALAGTRRRMAEVKRARLSAVTGSETLTPPAGTKKPKLDPLGLFNK